MILEHLRDRITGRAKKGERRDPRWPAVRRRFLEKQPYCAACGAVKKLSVHHKIPFQYAPKQELNPKNLIVLCTGGRFKGLNCHLILGHTGNFQLVCESVEADAAAMFVRLRGREYHEEHG